VELVPFDDNYVPPLALIKLFCESVHDWLSGDPKNVAVIHCRAGKGRTGLMVCAYLVYTGMCAEDALQLYADRRTYNNQGVCD
jgi:phosphatidylinositol-3,4,5-trisphosphate 3-phosphatase/dual-specificity protein phosphatase PTEN